MDVNRAIRTAVTTGKVLWGLRQVKKAAGSGAARMLIRAQNCPDPELQKEKLHNVPIYQFPGTNVDLGQACGKPFSIAALAVLEPGSSQIMTLVR